MGTGLPFRPGMFDGAISISAIQWMCHSNSKEDNPYKRLHCFFQSLYACLAYVNLLIIFIKYFLSLHRILYEYEFRRSARAVFQFYPENRDQCKLIVDHALKAGFQVNF